MAQHFYCPASLLTAMDESRYFIGLSVPQKQLGLLREALGQLHTKIEGLELVVNTSRPLSPEAVQKINQYIAALNPKQPFKDCTLSIDYQVREILVRGVPTPFTRHEYALLTTLTQQADEPVARRILLRSVWGAEYQDEFEYVRSYIYRLRKKIEIDYKHPQRILNISGQGYMYVTDQSQSL